MTDDLTATLAHARRMHAHESRQAAKLTGSKRVEAHARADLWFQIAEEIDAYLNDRAQPAEEALF